MLLLGLFSLYVSISGNPGTCEKYGQFQCNNGKCFSKLRVCNFDNDCGDSSDKSRPISFKITCLLITCDIRLGAIFYLK